MSVNVSFNHGIFFLAYCYKPKQVTYIQRMEKHIDWKQVFCSFNRRQSQITADP